MRKNTYGILLLGLMLLLAGCAAPQEEAQPTETPPAVEAPEIKAQGKLADTARQRMAPYEEQLEKIALQSAGNLTYTIPGDMLARLAQDAQEMAVEPLNGRYQFTRRQSGQHTYVATGLEVQEEIESEATDPPEDAMEEAPMDDQKMGDFSATGGGMFERVYVYDVAEDLSGGTIEITVTLNGEINGHELFSFIMRGDALYFVDAAMDLTAVLDELQNQGTYLVAAGRMQENRVEIVEYHVHSRQDVPTAAGLNWDQLLSTITPLSSLSAQGDQIQVSH